MVDCEQQSLSKSPQTIPAEEETLLNGSRQIKDKRKEVLGTSPRPPDGGCRAYIVVLGSFFCNGIIFGTINSGGIIFNALQKMLQSEGVENPAALASLTLSLAIGTTFFLSIVAGVLTDKFGIRVITILGGIIASLGMFLSSFCFHRPLLLTLTMGLMFGIGASLAYTPSLVILGHYFNKKMGIVNGVVTAGSSVFTVIIAALLQYLVDNYGLQVTFQVLSAMMTSLIFAGIVFKPLLTEKPKKKPSEENGGAKECCNQFINIDIWRNKKYVIWALAIPPALFGYFVPYVHLKSYCSLVLGEEAKTEIVIQVLGGASGIGRIAFGLIADRPWINRILLQQISFFCIGAMTMILTMANSLVAFIALVFFMGLFDGCFISLLGPIAFDIVGSAGASQAIGCLLALCSIPLTLGPFIAGVLFDKLGSYFIPFLCAGVPPIVGCFTLCFIKLVKNDPIEDKKECELSKKKNNVYNVTEFTHSTVSKDKGELPNQNNDELHVDVKRLVSLQHESSV